MTLKEEIAEILNKGTVVHKGGDKLFWTTDTAVDQILSAVRKRLPDERPKGVIGYKSFNQAIEQIERTLE